MTRIMALIIGLLAISTVACSRKPPTEEEAPATKAASAAVAPAPAAPAVSASDQQEATTVFTQRCVVCHGASGGGDGPASAGLNPKPKNFHDSAWQTSVTDEHIEKIVLYGGIAVGKSAAMPPNPDLAAKPGVVMALRSHVRTLKQ
jgi:mono/diheme cytochrome c family protein